MKPKKSPAKIASRSYCIKTLQSVEGNWFCVSPVYDKGKYRYYIDRVVMWGLVEKDGQLEHIAGFDNSGIPFPEHDLGDTYYVFGNDLAQNGKTWAEIYGAIKPNMSFVREIPVLEITR